MRLRFLFAPFLLLWGILLAPSASANSYVDVIAGSLSPTNHVVVDSSANPKLPGADALNTQIGHQQIWVVNVAAGQTGAVTPSNLHGVTHYSGTFLIIDAKGYHVQSYNVSQAIAANDGALIRSASASHRNDLYGTVSQFVTQISNLRTVQSPVIPATAAPAQPTNWAWAWALLWLTLGTGALVGGWFGMNKFMDWRRDRNEVKRRIDTQIITARRDIQNLADYVVGGADVSQETTNASLQLADAAAARKKGDLVSAQAYLDLVHTEVIQAERKLNPPAEPDIDAVKATPVKDRQEAEVLATDPAGSKVTINNTNYRTQAADGYRNYYAGGFHNGMYFYPGYYPYSFWGPGWGWSPVDVLLYDQLLEDRWGGSYYPPQPEYASAAPTTADFSSSGYDSPDTSTSFDDDYSYTPSSSGSGYDSGGSSSSFDSFDSGGGGFDSGSSDSGF